MWQASVGFAAFAIVWFALLGQVQRSQRLEGFERDPARRRVQGTWKGSGGSASKDSPSRLTRNTQLEHWSFWYQWAEYRKLWRWHLIVTAVTFGLIVGGGLAALHGHPRWSAGPSAETWAWSAVLLSVVVTVGFWLVAKADRYPDDEKDEPGWLVAFRSGLAYTVTTAIVALVSFNVLEPRGPSCEETIGVIGVLERLALITYSLVIPFVFFLILIWRRGKWKEKGFRYAGPLVTGGVALLVLGAGMGGLTFVIGRGVLGRMRLEGLHVETTFPDTFAVALLVVALLAGIGLLAERLRGRRRRRVKDVLDEYFPGDGPRFSRDLAWARSVAAKRSASDLGRQVDHQLGILFVVVVIIQVAEFLIHRFDGLAGRMGLGPPLFGWQRLDWIHGVAATAIVVFVFPGLQVMRLMFKSRTSRRQFGKVWDVVSFWPRRFHPFAAPCYAERAVPELRDRVMHHLAKDRGVIICAHSQGTVIAFAALQQITAEKRLAAYRKGMAAKDPDKLVRRYLQDLNVTEDEMTRSGDLDRVALITYGSPLSQLYGPFFRGTSEPTDDLPV